MKLVKSVLVVMVVVGSSVGMANVCANKAAGTMQSGNNVKKYAGLLNGGSSATASSEAKGVK